MRKAGILILVLVVAVVIGWQFLGKGKSGGGSGGFGGFGGGGNNKPTVTVKGDVGGEKIGLLEDPAIQKILAQKYGLKIDYTKAGSIDMVKRDAAGRDFLWPSSQIALEIYKDRKKPLKKSEIIFNSPIVLYSWDKVTAGLERSAIVQKSGEAYYVDDFPKLIKMINDGKEWKELGLTELYGKVSIFSTEPTKSNSGNSFAGLLANLANGGQVVDRNSVHAVLPTVKRFFSRLGYLEDSSGDLFKQFLSLGMGSKPIIVGYESQLVEFSIENPNYRDQIKQRVRTLYPKPTVWSSHPLIALTDSGTQLLTALQDAEIQKIAWEKHGFRSGSGIQNDPKILPVSGVPATVENVMPLPQPQVMEQIIDALSNR